MNGWIVIRIILLGFVLLIVSIEDYRHYRISAKWCLLLGGIGIIDSIVLNKTWIECSMGFLSISLLLMIVYIFTKGKGIGGGDIKLMAMSGVLLGWMNNILAFLMAGIVCIIIYPLRKLILPQRKRLAFAPYLSIGIMSACLWGDAIIEAYMLWTGI